MSILPKLLSEAIMARRLRIDKRWLRAEAEAGRIPSLRAGDRFLFDPEAVEQALLRRAREEREVPHG